MIRPMQGGLSSGLTIRAPARLTLLLGTALAGVVTVSCATRRDSPAQPMIGGAAEVVKDATPAVMLVQNRFGRDELACSGVLIHPKLVLTAAHCVVDGEEALTQSSGKLLPLTRNLRVGFGNSFRKFTAITTLIRPEDVAFPKGSQFQTPSFDSIGNSSRGSGDIALIRLQSPAPPDYPKALLPNPVRAVARSLMNNQRYKQPLLLLGYGVTSMKSTVDDSGILRKGTLKASYADNPGEFLARDDSNTTALCPGDSGGGAFELDPTKSKSEDQPYVLLGIASQTHATGDCIDTNAEYTDVGFHVPWIIETAKERFKIVITHK